MVRLLTRVAVVGGLLVAPSAASAGSILFTGAGTGANGVSLNASALFNVSGMNLTITLRNLGDTAGAGKDVPGNTLTGVLFDLLPSGIALTPVSATIQAGALVQANTCSIGPCLPSTTNVGGEFRYGLSGVSFPTSADRGIASAGYIGGAGNFGGSNLDGPPSGAVNGVGFGVIGPGAFNPNGGLGVPLIQDEVVFQMTISGGTLSTTDIQNVSFQYGTGFGEPRIASTPTSTASASVPEPATLLLLASGLAAVIRRRSRTGICERNARRFEA